MHSLEWVLFLSSQPVLSCSVDAMVGTINEQITQNSALRRTVYVRELFFTNTLQYDLHWWAGYKDDPGFAALHNTGSTLCQSTLQWLLLPTNIDDVHWALFRVDDSRGEINCGDTLNWSLPVIGTKHLQMWLRNMILGGTQSWTTWPMVCSEMIFGVQSA